jgi:hypothetical protein
MDGQIYTMDVLRGGLLPRAVQQLLLPMAREIGGIFQRVRYRSWNGYCRI